MQKLKPIYDFDSYSKPIADLIYSIFYDRIFKPLFEILDISKSKQNASTTLLIESLRDGRLQYVNGIFLGDLNATLSKQLREIGAVFNKTRRGYVLPRSKLPQDIKLAIQAGNEFAKDKFNKVDDFLREIQTKKIEIKDIEPLFGEVIGKLDKQFHTTTKKVTAQDIEIPIEPHLKEELKAGYTENLDKYIKKWNDEQILRLREVVSDNVSQGYRAENLVDGIIAERGVSKRKAEFLARQETSLMVSKYRQIRYEDVGIRRYVWSSSHDSRVRPLHRELNGHIFSFDNPPIADARTGERANPGEAYGCRCVAIPILSNHESPEREYAGNE